MPRKTQFTSRQLSIIKYLHKKGLSDSAIQLITGIEKSNVRYARIKILKIRLWKKPRITYRMFDL